MRASFAGLGLDDPFWDPLAESFGDSLRSESDRGAPLERSGRQLSRHEARGSDMAYDENLAGRVPERLSGRSDVAAFMLDQLESNEYLRSAPGVQS